jgi:hypothetical protein
LRAGLPLAQLRLIMFHSRRPLYLDTRRWLVVVLGAMAVVGLVDRGVCAETPRPDTSNPASVSYTPIKGGNPGRPSTGSPPARLAAPLSTPSITPSQVDTFAELLGEPRERVEQRLLWDPGLVPLVAAAVDARVARKSQGKFMTIGGFTILGAGVVAGFLEALSGLCIYGDCQSEADAKSRAGEAIALASVGIGLALGIPGIVMLARQSEAEDKAVDRYQLFGAGPPPAFPLGNSRALSTGSAGKNFSLSLWSFAF